MKICHIVENLNTGGLETVVIGLILEQIKNNHECIVICLFEEGELAYKLSGSDVNIVACGKTPGFHPHSVIKMRKTLNSFSPDVIHTHNNVAHIYCCLSTLLMACPIINTKHGLGAESTSKQARLFRLTRWKTSQYTFVSRDAMLSYIKRNLVPENKSMVLHNGIDISVIPQRNTEAKKNYLHDVGIEDSPVLIVMISRLNRLKDHQTLLLAFSRLLQQEKIQCKLVIIGDGETRDQIAAEVNKLDLQGNVILSGNKPDAYQLLQCFDIFVLSSHSEGHSIALLEAAAAGLPLIATDVGGNREIVNEDMGILVKHEDVDELKNALVCLVKDRSDREMKGSRASVWAHDNASVAAMALSYSNLYNKHRDIR